MRSIILLLIIFFNSTYFAFASDPEMENGLYSNKYDSLFAIGYHQYFTGDYQAALNTFSSIRKSMDIGRQDIYLSLFITLSLSKTGQMKEANDLWEDYLDSYLVWGDSIEVINKEFYLFSRSKLEEWKSIFPNEPPDIMIENGFELASQLEEINRVNIAYPKKLIKLGIEGLVTVRVRMDEFGEKKVVEVIDSPHEWLTELAIQSLTMKKGEPFIIHGKRFPVFKEVTLYFVINKKKKTD